MDPMVQFLLTALVILALPCLGVLVLIAFVVIGIPFARRRYQKWERAWGEFAQQTGLTYAGKTLEQIGQEAQEQAAVEPPGKRKWFRVVPPATPPRLVGQYGGFDVVIDSFSKDFGDAESSHERHFTRISVPIQNRENCRLAIRDRRFWSPRSALRAPEVQAGAIGGGDFDRRFIVRGDPAGSMARLFGDGSLAQQLVAQASRYEVRLEGQEMRLVADGLVTELDVLRSLLDLAVYLAVRVDRY